MPPKMPCVMPHGLNLKKEKNPSSASHLLSSYTLELQAMAKSSRLSRAPVMANHGRPPWTVIKFRHNKLPLQWLLLFSHLSWVFDDDAFGLFFRVVFVNFG